MMLDTLHERRSFLIACLSAGVGLAALANGISESASAAPSVRLSDEQWRQRLAPAAYAVLRKGGTERPYSSPLLKEHHKGRFTCAGCEQDLFSSSTKFESGTGWPSFWDHLPQAVAVRADRSMGMVRQEVRCSRCDGHLGHVFDDGPRPTGLRYCMNGAAMHFRAT